MSNIVNIKECFECKHQIKEKYQLPKCTLFGTKNKVTKKTVPSFCEDERHHEIGRCKEDAKFFELKEVIEETAEQKEQRQALYSKQQLRPDSEKIEDMRI